MLSAIDRVRLDRKLRPEIAPHGTGPMLGKTVANAPLSAGLWHRFRIRCETGRDDTRILARFWLDGEKEPETWSLEAADESSRRLQVGMVGVWSNEVGGRRCFDDFRVVSRATGEILLEENFEGGLTRWITERQFNHTIRPSSEKTFNLLLSHSPAVLLRYQIRGVDLTLAGDTHGGQVCWPTGRPVAPVSDIPSAWHSGLHAVGEELLLHVSRGLGTSGCPTRLFCRPEVTIFCLTPHIQSRPAP